MKASRPQSVESSKWAALLIDTKTADKYAAYDSANDSANDADDEWEHI